MQFLKFTWSFWPAGLIITTIFFPALMQDPCQEEVGLPHTKNILLCHYVLERYFVIAALLQGLQILISTPGLYCQCLVSF